MHKLGLHNNAIRILNCPTSGDKHLYEILSTYIFRVVYTLALSVYVIAPILFLRRKRKRNVNNQVLMEYYCLHSLIPEP